MVSAFSRKTAYTLAFLLFSAMILSSCSAETNQATVGTANTRVYFSPNGGCTEAIVQEIRNAQTDIRIQAYSFTSKAIAQALVETRRRGVPVAIILDKSNLSAKYSAGDFTAHAGIETLIDDRHAIAHNKIMIIDRETVITGSFNFTTAAETKNAENLLITKDRTLAEAYLKNWQTHRDHSRNQGSGL